MLSTPSADPRRRLAGLAVAALLALPGAAAAQAVPRPPAVTDSMIVWGHQLFNGSANCASCHGVDGNGSAHGPALTGAIWFHGPGTYDWLVEQIRGGIPAHQTYTREPMPMRGWSNMPDSDVRAVAAYVWSITHPPRPPAPARRRT
jgi:mono/diheme cytochrome c family protein